MTTPPRRRLVAIGLVAALLALGGVAAEWSAWQEGHEVDALVDLLTGWSLIGAGLAAFAVAPRSREGPLLLLTAVGWFVGTIVAPTRGINDDRPAQNASSTANGTPARLRKTQTAVPPRTDTRNAPTT